MSDESVRLPDFNCSVHNLRTRIAAVVHQYSVPPSMAELVADAVIRELNLDIATAYTTSQGREVCIEGFWTEEATND